MSSTSLLTPAAYEETQRKLAKLEARLQALHLRTDVDAALKEEGRRSYEEMIRQLRREIKLYEATREHEGQPV
jgi:hypothetical protein